MGEVASEVVKYHGERNPTGCPYVVRRTGNATVPLYRDRAWTGGAVLEYEWGCLCPGAQLLAMAILSDALGSSSLAALWCEDYAAEVVATWPGRAWTTDTNAVCVWLVNKTVQALEKRGEEPDPCWRRERLFGPGCSELKRPSNGAGGGGGK